MRATRNKKEYEQTLILGFDEQACRPIAGISLLVLVRVQVGILRASRELFPADGASKHVLRPSTRSTYPSPTGADFLRCLMPLRQCEAG